MKILICGIGPGGIQLGVLLQRLFPDSEISILARPSKKNVELFERQSKVELEFNVSSRRADLATYCGVFSADMHVDPSMLKGPFDIVVLANLTYEYPLCLGQLLERNLLPPDVTVLTASSRLGTTAELSEALLAYCPQGTIIVMSDYFAVTVRDPKNHCAAIASDNKSNLRFSIAGSSGQRVLQITKFFSTYVPNLTQYDCSWEMEQGNTNLFHVPIIVHEFLTERFFDPSAEKVLFYGPYPWGAYSQEVIAQIIDFEDELLALYKSLHLPRLNFFEFRMSRANLPLETIDPKTIERYPTMPTSDRRALHTFFLWMTERKRMGLEGVGKVVDASALPVFPQVVLQAGEARLPRIPLEDYATLKALSVYAEKIGLELPLFKHLCDFFERSCEEACSKYQYTLDFPKESIQSSAQKQLPTLLARSKAL